MKKFVYILLVLMFQLSCSKQPESLIVNRDFNEVFKDTFIQQKIDYGNVLGLKLGETKLSDMGNDFITETIDCKTSGVYSVTVNMSENNSRLLKHIGSNNICDFTKTINYKSKRLKFVMNFYNKILVKVEVKDFPIQFRNEIKLKNIAGKGYIKDISYSEWDIDAKRYWDYSCYNEYHKWENENILIEYSFKTDTSFYKNNLIKESESSFSMIDKSLYNRYLASSGQPKLKNPSQKEQEYRKNLNELMKTMLLKEFESKDADEITKKQTDEKIIEAMKKVKQ